MKLGEWNKKIALILPNLVVAKGELEKNPNDSKQKQLVNDLTKSAQNTIKKLFIKNNYETRNILIQNYELKYIKQKWFNSLPYLFIWFLNQDDNQSYLAVFDYQDNLHSIRKTEEIKKHTDLQET